MGAVEQSNAIYLTIADGKISRKVKEPTGKSVQRTNKNGRVVNEEFYKGWKGFITDIQVRDTKEYGKFWNITLSDDEGDAILQMNYSSGYSAAFLKTLPNVDLSTEVMITPKLTIEGEKKKTSLFISQVDETGKWKALSWAYTKDQPNGLPELRQIKVKGKITWDDSDIMEFLEKMVNTQVLPELLKKGRKKVVVAEVDTEETTPADTEDLPF